VSPRRSRRFEANTRPVSTPEPSDGVRKYSQTYASLQSSRRRRSRGSSTRLFCYARTRTERSVPPSSKADIRMARCGSTSLYVRRQLHHRAVLLLAVREWLAGRHVLNCRTPQTRFTCSTTSTSPSSHKSTVCLDSPQPSQARLLTRRSSVRQPTSTFSTTLLAARLDVQSHTAKGADGASFAESESMC
jgi:hypothetical protein